MSAVNTSLVHVRLDKEQDVFHAAEAVFDLGLRSGFDELGCNLMATAVSEIAMNVIRYAERGELRVKETVNKKGLVFVIADRGPGIADKEQALCDGYSSSKVSLGGGMGAAKRAMDRLVLQSRVGYGTTVRMEKYLPVPKGVFAYGAVSLADDHYDVNGDGYLIREFGGDKLMLAVIDGLGQGMNAYRSSEVVKSVIEANLFLPLDKILGCCASVLKAKGDPYGASIGLVVVKPRSFEYAAVGDTFMKILSGSSVEPVSQRGVVGTFRLPVVRVVRKAFYGRLLSFALCTDGIRDRFAIKDLPVGAESAELAGYIVDHYRREFGDATVLVTQFNRS